MHTDAAAVVDIFGQAQHLFQLPYLPSHLLWLHAVLPSSESSLSSFTSSPSTLSLCLVLDSYRYQERPAELAKVDNGTKS